MRIVHVMKDFISLAAGYDCMDLCLSILLTLSVWLIGLGEDCGMNGLDHLTLSFLPSSYLATIIFILVLDTGLAILFY